MGERRSRWKEEEIWSGEERFGARMERRERTEGEESRRTERESKELKQKVERRRNDERVENSEKEMRQIRTQGSKNRSIKEARWGERGIRKIENKQGLMVVRIGVEMVRVRKSNRKGKIREGSEKSREWKG